MFRSNIADPGSQRPNIRKNILGVCLVFLSFFCFVHTSVCRVIRLLILLNIEVQRCAERSRGDPFPANFAESAPQDAENVSRHSSSISFLICSLCHRYFTYFSLALHVFHVASLSFAYASFSVSYFLYLMLSHGHLFRLKFS